LRFEVLTLFPDLIEAFFRTSLLGRAVEAGRIAARTWNLREYAEGKHRSTDDAPYGGGSGMVMLVEPIARALDAMRAAAPGLRVVLMSPQGAPFHQASARRFAALDALGFVCGRYEGVDERVRTLVDEEISIGDYVLGDGEVAAMAVIDAAARLVPGVVGNAQSLAEESFAADLLEYPQYTRPAEFRGLGVPAVLMGGDHERVRRWRRRQALLRTRERRPDLFARLSLTAEDRVLLAEADAPDMGPGP
jgi:tRNA (guanine37-N1)-methyltransferase